VVMEWWGLAAGVLGLVLGILALVRNYDVRVTAGPDELEVDWGRRNAVAAAHAAMEPEPEAQEWVVDLSGKRRRREETVEEWNKMFLDALGKDREAFVKEWAEGSERLALSRQLTSDAEQARRRGETELLSVLDGLRYRLTVEAGRAMSERELDGLKLVRLEVLEVAESERR
jgi:hypothetical protein